MRLRSLVSCALGLCAATFATTFVSVARADTWTVMVYMEANNSLEPFATETFTELTSIGHKKGLEIVVEVDPGPKHVVEEVDGMPTGKSIKRVLIKKGKVVSENDDVGDDMTTGSGLANFIQYGLEQHPADHYALILWDHGAGWHGCCEADKPQIRAMSLPEITKGLDRGLKKSKDKLDLIAFDECLMSELEVAKALAPYVDVMVSSEELEPGEGMNYDKWLQAIVDDDTISPFDVGSAIADAYKKNIADNSGTPSYTMSVLDLNKVDELIKATGKLGKQLGKVADKDWNTVAAARAKADSYGGEEAGDYGIIDLGSFAKHASKIDGVDAGDDVLAALDKLVKYNVVGPMHKKAKGISIYLPQNGIEPDYAEVAVSEKWSAFLDTYSQGAGNDTTPPVIDDVSVAEQSGGSGGGGGGGGGGERASLLALKGVTQSKDVAQISVVLAEDLKGEHVFLGELPVKEAEEIADSGTKDISFSWNGSWPMLNDGKDSHLVPLVAVKRYDDDGKTMALVAMPAEFDDGSGSFDKKVRVMFAIDLATNAGKPVGAYSEEKKNAGAIKLKQSGARLRPFHIVVNDKGAYKYSAGKEEFSSENISMKALTLPDRQYMVGLHLTDFAGNSSTKLTDVSLLMATLRGGQKKTRGCNCTRAGCSIDDERGGAATWSWSIAAAAVTLTWLRRRATAARR